MNIFVEATALLRAAERQVLAERESNTALLNELWRLTWYPLKFLAQGVEEQFRLAAVWAFMSFSSLLFGAWLVNILGISQTEYANLVMLASMILPLLMLLFAIPSMYGHRNLTTEDVASMVEHLRSRKIESCTDLELIAKLLKPFEERTRSRITAMKWLVGLLWAGFTYTYSKGIEGVGSSASDILSYAFVSAFLFLGVIAAYLAVWGYEASISKVFSLIEFAGNDRCAELTRAAKSAG